MNSDSYNIVRVRPVRFDRIFFLGVMLHLIITVSYPQQAVLELRSAAGTNIPGRPATLLTLPVQFINLSDRPLNIRPSVTLPPGWRRVAAPGRVVLKPGGTDMQLLILTVPHDAAVQSHPVVVSAFLGQDSVVAARIEFRVAVERTVSIEVLLIDAPRTMVAGSSSEFIYEVLNRGNDTAQVSLFARSSRGYIPVISPKTVRLPAGASARVTAGVPSDQGEHLKAPHMLEFQAILRPEGKVTSMTTSSDVVPKAPSAQLRRVELPIYGAIRGTTEDGRFGMQAELVGGGSLRLDRSDRIQFLFRGPETQKMSVLGMRDEYRMRYEFGKTSITAGDDTYALTPLTDAGRTAIGVGARTELGKVGLGAYMNQTRFAGPVAKQSAGYLRYAFANDLSAGVNILHRSDRVIADLVTLSANGTAFRNARFDLEAGRSKGTKGTDHAYALRLGGMEPWLSYEIRTVNAGPGFSGYYRGVRFSSVSLSGRNAQDMRMEFSARDERRTPEADTVFGKSPRSNFLQAGVGYTNLITLSYRVTNMSDPVSASHVDRRQDIVEIRSAASFDMVFLSASAEIGAERDRSAGSVRPTQRFQTSASVRPSVRQSYNLSVEMDRSPDQLTGVRAERLSANLLASYLLTDRTQAQISLFGSRLTGAIPQTYSLADASIEHIFPWDHRVRFHGRRSLVGGSTPELAASLEYSMPLALPLGFDRSSGLLSGRVVEKDNRGIPDVLVMLGAFAAITDENGRFAFNDLAPGAYMLTIDRATTGIDRITTTALPIQVNIGGAAASSITLSVIRSATLRGRIRLFEGSALTDSSSAALTERPVDETGLVSVELVRESEVLRRVSDSRGRFSFTDLRPGRWTMKVSPFNLASDRAIESPETLVDIAEGGTVESEVRIVPRRRSIRLIQLGGVLTPQPPDDELDEVCGTSLIRRASQGEGFVVQVSSWAEAEQAKSDQNRVQRLAAGRRVWIDAKNVAPRGTFHRVLVGPFPTRDSARDWCKMASGR